MSTGMGSPGARAGDRCTWPTPNSEQRYPRRPQRSESCDIQDTIYCKPRLTSPRVQAFPARPLNAVGKKREGPLVFGIPLALSHTGIVYGMFRRRAEMGEHSR